MPGARSRYTELVPLLAWVLITIWAIPYRLFGSCAAAGRAANSCDSVAPGSSLAKPGPPAGSPVTLKTTRSAPDLRVPPTEMALPFMLTVMTGSPPDPEAGAAALAAMAGVAA